MANIDDEVIDQGEQQELQAKRLGLKFSEDEWQKLEQLAVRMKRSKSDTIRRVIEACHNFYVGGQDMPDRGGLL